MFREQRLANKGTHMKKNIKITASSDTSMANGSYNKNTAAVQWDKHEVVVRLIALIIDLNEEDQRELLKELDIKYTHTTGKLSEKQRKHIEDMRKHTRKPDLIPVECSTNDVSFTNFINDISDGGVYIKTNAPFYVGQEIQLDFSTPETKNTISVVGEVVRVDAQGIGVKFTNVGDKH